MGSCKIFLHREVAQDLSLFHIVPFEQICLDIGFTHLISIRRWVRNDFSVQTQNFALSSKELSSENDVNFSPIMHNRSQTCVDFDDDEKSMDTSFFDLLDNDQSIFSLVPKKFTCCSQSDVLIPPATQETSSLVVNIDKIDIPPTSTCTLEYHTLEAINIQPRDKLCKVEALNGINIFSPCLSDFALDELNSFDFSLSDIFDDYFLLLNIIVTVYNHYSQEKRIRSNDLFNDIITGCTRLKTRTWRYIQHADFNPC